MRWLLAVFLTLGAALMASADTFVYVSMAPEEKIQIFRLADKDGTLTPIAAVKVAGAPGCLSVDAKKKFLFASLRTTSTLASFALDSASGKLEHLGTAPLPKGENAAFVAADASGRWLLSASYAGGKVVVHKLEDGKIQTPAVQTVETAKTAHAIAFDADNRWVFVPHVADNAVYQFLFAAATSGRLGQPSKAAGGTAKAGPRHLAFHPSQKWAFTSDETGNSITAYSFDPSAGLKPVQTVSTLPDDFTGKNSTAEVKVHPSGKFVWVSNRGHDSLAGFAINDKTGKLTSLGQTATEKTPRSFTIDPTGRYVLAAGEGTGKLAVYRVDLDKGSLERIHTYEVGKSLTWVMTVTP